ncbi:nicotinate-nucleotide--dimethylbenzimidazole phosphoribosyltransferase [Neptuniibacter sp. QD48_11]|uniref:nicotinate-nucleotide--dimethylbenzimidazole phosphoribosyltransferase n=1 Tax=unclassified Neptuniibacter TaxID=2630693 RepID=UPI0039F4922C
MNLQEWSQIKAKPLNVETEQAALSHQANLTKPPGSLGVLEKIAVQMAAMQAQPLPSADRVSISIFAADHGVAAQNVSAFPQEVTSQMILNFAEGGAAIAVLAKQLQAQFEVINLGTVVPVEHHNVLNRVIASQSSDISKSQAMSSEQLVTALNVGREAVLRAKSSGAQLFIAGEMGIGNTTVAATVLAAAMNLTAQEVVGAGTGVSGDALEHKTAVIDQALKLHLCTGDSPFELLQSLAGFEIVAMVGAYLTAAREGITVVVDGFISTAAAYMASIICPLAKDWMIFGHQSAEKFHHKVLVAMSAEPLLALDMRLGEGSGAATAVNVIQTACLLHKQMATFSSAGVSEKSD